MPQLKELTARMGKTPLTDPRSLGGSLLLHAALAVIASLAAIGVAIQQEPDGPRPIQGALEPVDNRAKPDESGGGAPGELTPDRLASAVASLAPPSPATTAPGALLTHDPATDALLSEIVPTRAPTSDAVARALPGPQTSSLATVAGPNPAGGGGGGSGGGVGGGVGRGVGPGTEFFGAREHAASFAYVIDCSGSMASNHALDAAKRELLSSLYQLPPDAQFAVIFYNQNPTTLADQAGARGLMLATKSSKTRVRDQLSQIVPDGGTDHVAALRTALALRPEVVFFLTDADLMSDANVDDILRDAGKTRIQAVEFGRGIELAVEKPLRRLATATGGTYRYIDVIRLTGQP
jgi:von Willebrand factor type A domain